MTYIIAEIGSNYKNKNDAFNSVKVAKECGADAVKFQMFTPEEMYGSVHFSDQSGIPRNWVAGLKCLADDVAIDFMCTGFSPEGVRFLDQYVSSHKIASSDSCYAQLIDAAKISGKRVFISTGGSSLGEIERMVNYFGDGNLVLMYCNSEYPSTWHDLRQVDVIRNKFNRPVGYSCHTVDVYTAVAAVHFHRASVIEKHLKCKKMATADSQHSILPDQFSHMVDCIRDRDRIPVLPALGEHEMGTMHNRRLIAIKKIAAGDIYTFGDNYGTFRSRKNDLHGWPGFDWPAVEGLPAKRNIDKGDSIGFGDT